MSNTTDSNRKPFNAQVVVEMIVNETRLDPKELLIGLLETLAFCHLHGAAAFPDYAAPEGTPGAIAEVMALEHWNSKQVWHLGQSMPPFESLFEAVWMSLCHERDRSEAISEHYEEEDDVVRAMCWGDLAHTQEALRCLFEEAINWIGENKIYGK